MQNYSIKHRTVCAIIALVMGTNLLPATPLAYERSTGHARLEQYLDRAQRVRNAESWHSICETGLLAAMSAWESVNVRDAENASEWEKARSEAEVFYRMEAERAFAGWSVARMYESVGLEYGSALAAALRTAAESWNYALQDGEATRAVHADEAENAKAQWHVEVERIIDEYYSRWEVEHSGKGMELMERLSSLHLSDDEKKLIISRYSNAYASYVKNEYALIAQAETNMLMNELLYDQHSIRKVSDSEAAQMIARGLARDAERQTDSDIDSLVRLLDTELVVSDADGISLDEKDWFSRFEKTLASSMAKWDEAERNFLISRSEWEKNAERVYLNDEEVWAAAYKELSDRRKAWNEKITEKIYEMRKTLMEKESVLAQEIEAELVSYVSVLQSQKTDHEKTIEVQQHIYNTYRDMMKMCADGIDAWYEHWSEKYNGLYSYWKTEDVSTALREEYAAVIKAFLADGKISNEYLKNKQDAQKVKNNLAIWKKAYKAMLMNELSKRIAVQENAITLKEVTVAALKELVDGLQKRMSFSSSSYQDSSDSGTTESSFAIQRQIDDADRQIKTLEKELVHDAALKTKLYSWQGCLRETTYEQLAAVLLENDLLKNLFVEIQPHNAMAGEELAALWDSNDIIYGTDENLAVWLDSLFLGYDEVAANGSKTHVAGYYDQAVAAMTKLYQLTGSTLSRTYAAESDMSSESNAISYMDELENEVVKAQAVKTYWDAELAVAQAVVDYVNNETSSVDWQETSREKLNVAMKNYEAKKAAYDSAVESLEMQQQKVGALLQEAEAAADNVQKALAALKEAQDTYRTAQNAYNSLSSMANVEQIKAVLAAINNSESGEDKKQHFDEYYRAVQAYANASLKRQKVMLLSQLEYAETQNKIFSYEELDAKAVIDDDVVFNELKACLYTECMSELAEIEDMRLLVRTGKYADGTAVSELDISNAQDVIDASVMKINVRIRKAQKEHELARQYIQDKITTVNAAVDAEQKFAIYIASYSEIINGKLASLKHAGKTESALYESCVSIKETLDAIARLAAKKQLAYVRDNRHDDRMHMLLNYGGLTTGISALIESTYEANLFAAYGDELLLASVAEQYGSCKAALLNKKNDEAKDKIVDLLNSFAAPNEKNDEALVAHVVSLYAAADGLGVVGRQALELYVAQLVRDYAQSAVANKSATSEAALQKIAEEYAADRTAHEGAVMTHEQNIALYNSWQEKLQNVETIVEIIADERFAMFSAASGIKRTVYDSVIAYAADLLLTKVSDFSGKEAVLACLSKTEESAVLKTLGKNAVAREKIAETIFRLYNERGAELFDGEKQAQSWYAGISEQKPEVIQRADNAQRAIELFVNKKEMEARVAILAPFCFARENFSHDACKMYIASLLGEERMAKLAEIIAAYGKTEHDFYEAVWQQFRITDELSEYDKAHNISAEFILCTLNEQYALMVCKSADSNGSRQEEEIVFFTDSDLKKMHADIAATQMRMLAEINEQYEADKKRYGITEAIARAVESESDDVLAASWYSTYLAGRDVLYAYLCAERNMQDIKAANSYLVSKDEAQFDDLARYVEIHEKVAEYNAYLDGDVDTWIAKQDLAIAEELRAVMLYGIAVPLRYDAAARQASLIASANGVSTSAELIRILQDDFFAMKEAFAKLYEVEENARISESIRQLYAKEAHSVAQSKAALAGYSEWQVVHNSPIQERISENKKEATDELLSIDFAVSDEATWHDMCASYFFSKTEYEYEDESIKISTDEMEEISARDFLIAQMIDAAYEEMMQKNCAITAAHTMRHAYLATLGKLVAVLKNFYESTETQRENVNAAYKAMTATEAEYKNAFAEQQTALTAYSIACRQYNAMLDITNGKYDELECARLEHRVQEEVQRWAENEYLHTDSTEREAGYESPVEKFERVKKAHAAAAASFELISGMQTNRRVATERAFADESYNKLFDEYSVAYEAYYTAVVAQYELNAAIEQQKQALAFAEAKVEQARSALIQQGALGGAEPDIQLYDKAASYFARIEESGGTYAFRLNYTACDNILVQQHESMNDAKDSYFAAQEKLYRMSDETMLSMQKARYDAFEWYTGLEKRPEYLEKVVLAAMYLESLGDTSQQDEWFAKLDDGRYKYENPLNDILSGANVTIVHDKFHASNLLTSYNSFRTSLLKKVYEDVMSGGGEADIAKYFLYRGTYLANVHENLEERAGSLLREQTYAALCENIKSSERDNTILAAYFSVVAAGFYAMITPVTLWMLVPAIAATIASLVFVDIAFSFFSKRKDIQEISGAERSVRRSKEQSIEKLIQAYDEAEQNRVEEQKKLDLLKYGTSDYAKDSNESGKAKEITYDMFRASLAEMLKQSNLVEKKADGTVENVLEMSKLEAQLFDNVARQTNMKDLFESVQKKKRAESGGYGYASAVDVIAAMGNVLAVSQKNAYEALESKAMMLRKAQYDAAKTYNNSVAELTFGVKAADDVLGEHISIQELATLAENAWGTATWRETVHRNNLQALYSKFGDEKYISYRNVTESYIENMVGNLSAEYSAELSNEMQLLYDARKTELDLLLNDMHIQRETLESQILQILARAEEEWVKAEGKINSSYNMWREKFIKEYAEKSNAWEDGYTDFLSRKEKWLVEQYVYAQNVGDWELLEASGLNAGKEIAAGLAAIQEAVARDSAVKKISADMNAWVSSLYDGSLMEQLGVAAGNLAVQAKNAGKTVRKGNSMSIAGTESLRAALETQGGIESEMKRLAAKLAAEQASLRIEQLKQQYMSRIAAENDNMDAWEEQLVSSAGYHIDGVYRRTVTVDAYMYGRKSETQIVRKYEHFKTDVPGVKLSVGNDADDMMIMTAVANAQKELDEWSTRIFGAADADGGIKQHVIARNIAESGDVSKYSTSEENDGAVASYKKKKARLEELEKVLDKLNKISENTTKDYEAKQSEYKELQQEYRELQKSVVEIRDGELGEHLGYVPVFTDNPDFTKDAEANIAAYGRGQLNVIMLDFTWNEMMMQHGSTELAKAPYEKKLWAAGGLVEPPTLKQLTSIACDIIANATGHKWIALMDDALFGTLDLAIEYKTPLEVAVDIGKAGASFALGMGMSAAGSAVSGAIDKLGSAALKGVATAAWSAGSSYATSVANGYMNAVHVDANGRLAMDWESANRSWWSASTVASSLGAGVTGGLSTGLTNALSAETNKFYGSLISLGTKVAGNATEYGVYVAYAGGDWRQAYDDMGGITINVASIGAVADMLGSAVARSNGSGQLGTVSKGGELTWERVINNLQGTGVLEVNFGSGGVTARIGTGGIDVAGSMYTFAKRAADRAALRSYARSNGSAKGDAAYKAYVYGDWTQENTAARLASGKDELVFAVGTEHVAQTVSNGSGGRTIAMQDSGNAYENAVRLGHEAYRDGMVGMDNAAETARAAKVHTEMALRMRADDKLKDTDGQLVMDMAVYQYAQLTGDWSAFGRYVGATYDSSADYWKLLGDGSIEYDGKANLYDENGNLIYKTKSQGIEGSLVEILCGKNATEEQKHAVRGLMEKYGMTHTVDKANPYNSDKWYWNSRDGTVGESGAGKWSFTDNVDVDALNMGKRIDGATVFGQYGNTIVARAFVHHYDLTVDANIAANYGRFLEGAVEKDVPDAAWQRYANLYAAKENFYNNAGSFFESNDIRISGSYGDYIRNKNGVLLSDYLNYYKSYNNLHYGIDLVIDSGSQNILAGIGGKVFSNDWNDAEGWTLQMEFVYNFEDIFISTGIYGEYGHLKEKSPLINDTYYSSSQVVGVFGNTGEKTTGAHLHYSIYTTDNKYYSTTTMQMLLGNSYTSGSMYNGSWRTVYDPTAFYDNKKFYVH